MREHLLMVVHTHIKILRLSLKLGISDAIKVNLIPPELTQQQTSIIYTSEANVLNMALFGITV